MIVLTPKIYVASLIVSLAGFLFGYDAGAIGPVTEMPYFFHLNPIPRGMVVATILFSALPFSLAAGPLANKDGRVPIVAIGGVLGIAGNLIFCSSFSLAQFIVGRAVVGAGQGFYFTISGVWQVESAPDAIRRQIGAMTLLLFPFGLASGYFISYGTVQIDSTASWRQVTGVHGVVSLVMTLLLLVCLTALAHWYLIDRIGRRISIAIGALGMAVCLFIIGALAASSVTNSFAVQWNSICLIILYTVFCQVFFVGQILVVAGEILPNEIRSTVSSFGRAALTIGNIILAVATPRWFEISDVSVMFTLGGFNLFSVTLAIF
ncbi:major facilitator superfamily domain-containing protein [Dioszegia hungarica]|uniref:Major facilitator superfamily domain-containing protein n=1 Tax=Dioszegia hungarica TaxID=4972 RepID=A0AA38LUI2_9TREE|nr:major facilitator superfamily domain-containing protein [Dioszegia hungarica]KAI9635730.1 major facilitator superfamily domain-containing protein [Dioszegia hungarica]